MCDPRRPRSVIAIIIRAEPDAAHACFEQVFVELPRLSGVTPTTQEKTMGIGKGALLWLLGIPLPIIILLVLFWR